MKGKILIKNVGAGFHACPNEVPEKYKNIGADVSVCQNERGITLIALVITIIVLLILAGVTISIGLFGDNGIITRANEAKFKQEISKYKEELELYKTEKSINTITGTSNSDVETLYASKNSLQLDGIPQEGENITNAVNSFDIDKFGEKLLILTGKFFRIDSKLSEREKKWLSDMGIENFPLEIDENNTLLSSELNLEYLTNSEGTVVIPDIVTSIGEGAFNNVGAKKIIIPLTVTEIKDSAFSQNETLEEIIFAVNEEGYCNCKTIGDRAFYVCTSLKSITIPGVKDAETTIGSSVFRGCTNLSNIKFSENITLKTVEREFLSGCSRVAEIELPKTVTTIRADAFYNTSITEIKLSVAVETIDSGAFRNTPYLEKIEIEENEYYEYDQGVLYENKNNKCKVKCIIPKEISNIEIKTETTSLGTYMFSKSSVVGEFKLPKNISEIEDAAFYGISIDNFTITVVEESDYFIVLDDILYGKIEKSEQRLRLVLAIKGSINTLVLPEKVEVITPYAFRGNTIETIILNDDIKTIMNYAFYGAGLISIEIPSNINLDGVNPRAIPKDVTISVKNNMTPENYTVGSLYKNNDCLIKNDGTLYLTTSKINGILEINNNQITSIGSLAFVDQNSMTEIKILSEIKSIGSLAFEGCSKLEKVTVYFNSEEDCSIGTNAFRYTNLNTNRCVQIYGVTSLSGAPWGIPAGTRGVGYN